MSLKIKTAQLNFTVGDLENNSQKIISAWQNAEKDNCDLIIFSELSLTGYPPEDLLLKAYFIRAVEEKILEIAHISKNSNTAILLGAPASFTDKHGNQSLYNAAFLIEKGEIKKVVCKCSLPNHGVFDEKRYFTPASNLTVINFRKIKLAILICEDIWNLKHAFLLGEQQIDGIIVINASPFHKNVLEKRLEITTKFIANIKKPLIYVNQVGAQDSLVFDGSSFVLDSNGKNLTTLNSFEEDCATLLLDKEGIAITSNSTNSTTNYNNQENAIYNALILGLRDYIIKNGFDKVLIGMSGGIDSALVATIAVDALGSDKVKLVALPSNYNSQTSMDDAINCSKNLGIKLDEVAIQESFNAVSNSLKHQFSGTEKDLTEENLQSRIRGVILMAISNKFGNLLITTGNKSEMAVGYATIYGDMCGSFNPVKDVYKTEIYKLAEWRNHNIPTLSKYQKLALIPENIITKEPSAELRPDQKDSDSLPDYDLLDKILTLLIEEQNSISEIIEKGLPAEIVKKVAKLFYNSEYKRKQAVIGVKISSMSFDRDRRYPITNKFTS